MLLSVLSDALSGIQPKSRRQDVVKDVIDNNDYRKQSKKRAEEIKLLLKNFTGLTPKQIIRDMF